MVTILLNWLVLILSVILFVRYKPGIAKNFFRRRWIPLLLLVLMPLLSYHPSSTLTTLLVTASILLLLIKPNSPALNTLLNFSSLSLFFFNALMLSRLLTLPPSLSFDWERTVFQNVYLSNTMNQAIADFRHASPFTPLFTGLFYNKALTSFYFFQNLLRFLHPRNFYDLLLLANLYPLCWGVYFYFKEDFPQTKIWAVWLGELLFISGLNRTVEKTTALYPALPLLLFFIIRGLPKINHLVYFLLLIISLLQLLHF